MASLHTVQHRGCILKRTPHNFHRFSAPTCSCLLVVLFGVDKRIPQDSLIPLCWPSWTVVFTLEIILGLIDFILAHPLSFCLCYVVCAVCEFGGTRIFFRIDWLHRATPVKFWVCAMLCVCVCLWFFCTRICVRVHWLHRGTPLVLCVCDSCLFLCWPETISGFIDFIVAPTLGVCGDVISLVAGRYFNFALQ